MIFFERADNSNVFHEDIHETNGDCSRVYFLYKPKKEGNPILDSF